MEPCAQRTAQSGAASPCAAARMSGALAPRNAKTAGQDRSRIARFALHPGYDELLRNQN
jgi:hypothetical protein